MKKLTIIFISLFIVQLMGGAVSVLAEKGKMDTVPYSLGEIVVSANENPVESNGTLYRITAEDIEKSGVRTLDEAIKKIPGLYVRYGAAGTPRIDIRGLKTRHVRLLLNGIPVKNTYDDQFDPTTIPVDHIAEIKVSVGTSSLLYGPGGSAGVINIITKKGKKGGKGSLSSEFSSNDYYSGNATISGAGKTVDGILSATMTQKDAFELSSDFDPTSEEDGDERENSDFERFNLFTGIGFNPTDFFELGLTMSYLKGENGLPPSTINDKKDIYASSPKYERIEDMEGYSVQLAMDYDISETLSLRGWGFMNQTDTETRRYDDDAYNTIKKKGSYSEDATSDIYGVSTQLNWRIKKNHQFNLSLMMEGNDWESQGFEIDKKNKAQAFTMDSELQFYSLAGEYSLPVGDKLNLVMGYGHHFMEKESGDNDDDFAFMFSAGYQLLDATRLKASMGKTVRFPSTKQLYDVGSGNPDLDAERIYNYEVGIEQNIGGDTLFSVTGYVRHAKDFIEKDENDLYLNYEEYHFKGVEFGVENHSVENLVLSAAYSFMDSEDKSEGSQKDELQYRPGQKVVVEGHYHLDSGFKAYLAMMHYADQYFYSKTTPLEKKGLDDFTVVDAMLSQSFRNETLELYVRGENLLDELYYQSYGVPCAGRTLYAGIKYRF